MTEDHRFRTRPCRLLMALLVNLSLLAVACGGLESDATTEAGSTASEAPTATPEPEPTSTPMPEPTATPVDPESTVAPEPTTTPQPAPTAPTPTTDTATDTGPDPADGAAEALEWFVGFLNDRDADPAEVEERFAPIFLAEIPATAIIDFSASLPDGPWTLVESEFDGENGQALVMSADGPFVVSISVEPEAPHLIQGLFIEPAPDAPAVESAADFSAALDDFAGVTRLGVFEVVDGSCQAVFDLDAHEAMAIGSIFKLWVLAELARQVEIGDASWDELIPIEDRFKSSPDGQFYDRDPGTEVSLGDLAAEMIAISDNTATDHLMFRLGRQRIEQTIADIGVEAAARNVPMLSTADMFRIKFDPEPPNPTDYLALDETGRRQALDDMIDTAPSWVLSGLGFDGISLENADGVPIDQPRNLDTLEWFASPADICRTLVFLADLAERPGLEAVAQILERNPGLDVDPSQWSDVRFKGGSEPGLVAGGWMATRTDGRVFVVAGGLSNDDAPVPTAQAIATMGAGFELAAAVD